ncbi:MAG: hypothetical protein ACRDHO_05670 [Actinomycetota bacterium]
MRPRRWLVALVAVGATVSLGIGAAADEALPGRPKIHFAEEVPDDLRALASSTWDRFLQGLPARSGCLVDVTLRGAWRFGTRAAYDPGRHLVTVRIPGTAPNLRATMVHEFAHHLEFTCPAQRRLRPRFLAAQGLPPTTSWRRGQAWAQIPSEQFAEAMVRVVLGAQPGGLVVIRPEALRAIRDWGRGG